MAQYLPVLLVSVSAVTAQAPDDSSLDTQAIGQVDYLSHDWQEEDVAKSWRNMTRRKDSIQNGARLENASWRTWWKQRNNLPTVSPETLNWLKDSDVTWLYGPLHTAADWAPPPRQSPDSGCAQLSSSPSPEPTCASLDHRQPVQILHSNSPWALKPILKHRSISELLSISFPSTPNSDPMELDDESPKFNRSSGSIQDSKKRETESHEMRKRPKLTHTKSDTNVHRRNPFRGDSPPLPLIPEASVPSASGSETSFSRLGSPSETSSCGQQKRHISFNTFVEQCIAIEKPNKSKDGFGGYEDDEENDGYGLEEDGYREDDEDDDDYDSEEDVLEMRLSSRSHTPIRRRVPSLSTASSSSYNGYEMSSVSSDREHVTIAPIAPTILKTSASPSPTATYHGHITSLWEEDEIDDEEALFATGRSLPSTVAFNPDRKDSVNLVFVPPQGSVYAERLALNAASPPKATAGTFGFPNSPPQVSSSLRPGSFDDTGLLEESRPDSVETDPPFDPGFDFFGGDTVEHYAAYRATPRDATQSRNALPEDVRSTDSKGSSGSASEEGTVVPPSVPLPSSSASSSRTVLSKVPSPVRGPSPPHPSRSYTHVHQTPSPAPSATSTGTSTTTSTGSGSGLSYCSPFLEPRSRGRSTSPITSASPPGGDDMRGRAARRGSSNSLSEERDPPRGRSRSRSIGGSSPLDGSVSPRSGSRSGLSRRASIEGGGLGGFVSASWREASLSPEDCDGGRRGGRMRARGRRSPSEKSGEGSSSSLSPPGVKETDTVPIPVPPASRALLPPEGIRGPVANNMPSSTNPSTVAAPNAVSKPIDIPNKSSPHPIPIPDVFVQHTRVVPEESTIVGRAVSSAKGYLGSFWSSNTTAQSQTTSTTLR